MAAVYLLALRCLNGERGLCPAAREAIMAHPELAWMLAAMGGG